MKKILFATVIFFTSLILNAQEVLPKNVNDEFGHAVIYNYWNGNGNLRLLIMEALRKKGYEPMDIDVLVESILKNSKNRNIILDVFHDYFGYDKEYLYMNLLSLEMSATTSKYLTDYIIEEKYKTSNTKDKK